MQLHSDATWVAAQKSSTASSSDSDKFIVIAHAITCQVTQVKNILEAAGAAQADFKQEIRGEFSV